MICHLHVPSYHDAKSADCDCCAGGGFNKISTWLTIAQPTAGTRGRKRPRKEEEDTPPRPSLDDLEHEDRQQQRHPFSNFSMPRQTEPQQPEGRADAAQGSLRQTQGSLAQPQGTLQQAQTGSSSKRSAGVDGTASETEMSGVSNAAWHICACTIASV